MTICTAAYGTTDKRSGMMEIRQAVAADLNRIMDVYRAAQDFMIRTGNPTQWGHFYPTAALLAADIAAGACYVLTAEGVIRGVFVMLLDGEPAYRVIENGAWPSDGPYVTIHRIASDGSVHGVVRAAADFCAGFGDRIRADTHADNRVMQRQLERYGFVKCGTVRLANGSPRIAYQWDRAAAPQNV